MKRIHYYTWGCSSGVYQICIAKKHQTSKRTALYSSVSAVRDEKRSVTILGLKPYWRAEGKVEEEAMAIMELFAVKSILAATPAVSMTHQSRSGPNNLNSTTETLLAEVVISSINSPFQAREQQSSAVQRFTKDPNMFYIVQCLLLLVSSMGVLDECELDMTIRHARIADYFYVHRKGDGPFHNGCWPVLEVKYNELLEQHVHRNGFVLYAFLGLTDQYSFLQTYVHVPLPRNLCQKFPRLRSVYADPSPLTV